MMPIAIFGSASPERAPARVVLAEVLMGGGVLDQPPHLRRHVEPLVVLEVLARELVLHPRQHLYRTRVLLVRVESVSGRSPRVV